MSFITQFKIEFLLPFTGCRNVLGKMTAKIVNSHDSLIFLANYIYRFQKKIMQSIFSLSNAQEVEIAVYKENALKAFLSLPSYLYLGPLTFSCIPNDKRVKGLRFNF